MSNTPSYDEIINGKNRFIYSDDDYLYIRPEPKFTYDNNMWKVNRKTREVVPMNLVLFGPEKNNPNFRHVSGENYLRI